MASASSTRDPFSRSVTPAAGFHAPGRDRFKELAERQAAKKGAPRGDAFAARPAPRKPAPPREAVFKPASSPPAAVASGRVLANGAALKVVAAKPRETPVEAAKQDEASRKKRAAKTSSLVLVSASAGAAVAELGAQTGGGGQSGLAMPVSSPKGQAKPKSGGGGGGPGGGGAGAGQPPRDRILNQDDLMGVLIVLALLLLLALYFFRGGGATADASVLNTQSVASEPIAEPAAAPPDPFGDRAVDLTPKSPLPPEPAAVEATPPPPKTVDITLSAYFCTASSELTPAAMAALDRQAADRSEDLAGKELVVAGYADTRGSAEYNVTLGNARASAVADFLRSRNFAVAELKGVGELEGLADNENCSNQRRVDIRLASGPAQPPSRSCAPPPEMAELACG